MKNKIQFLLSFFFLIFLTQCKNNTSNDENRQTIANNLSPESETTLKRYDLKSGIVKYKTNISGKVMGSTIKGSGTEELYFKNWGAVELKKRDEKKVTHINIFGQKKTEVDEEHTINKLDNGKSYNVDVKNKVIYVTRDPAMEMMKTFNNGNVVNPGEEMLKSMGGKKVGTEKILGYNCEVWEIPGGKQWIYKGLPLKLQMTVMGITTTNEATQAKFNTSVPDKYFKLPDYPVQQMDSYQNDDEYAADQKEMKANAAKLKKMSYQDYKQMLQQNDPQSYKNMSEEEMKMSYKMMKKMAEHMTK